MGFHGGRAWRRLNVSNSAANGHREGQDTDSESSKKRHVPGSARRQDQLRPTPTSLSPRLLGHAAKAQTTAVTAGDLFDVSIVLVEQDYREGAEACATAFAQVSSGGSLELVLVDDAAPAPSALLREAAGSVRHLRHANRLGVVASWNEAGATSLSRYLLFVAPHLRPVAPPLSALIATADAQPFISAFSAHVTAEDGSLRPAGLHFASAACLAQALPVASSAGTVVLDRSRLPLLGDGCLLVRRDAFAAVGGFDGELGVRAALLDLCLKLRGRGRRVALLPSWKLNSLAALPRPSEDAADATVLRRRWGVERGSSPDALWVEGRTSLTHTTPFAGRAGHFCEDVARLPPPFVEIGEHSYFVSGTRFLTWTAEERIRIGRYCSFARDVTLMTGGGHSTDTVSTFPFESRWFGASNPTRSSRTTRDTVVGSDVWVADGAIIGSGVEVGHGAVVGVGAVVLSDVPPYAIVSGNPAEVRRFRFGEETVAALLRIAWWDWPEAKIREELEWFFRPVAEFIARFDPAATAEHSAPNEEAAANTAVTHGVGRSLGLAGLLSLLSRELGEPIDADTPLLSAGLVDSMRFERLLVALESYFGLPISSGAVGADNFDTPQQMLAFLRVPA